MKNRFAYKKDMYFLSRVPSLQRNNNPFEFCLHVGTNLGAVQEWCPTATVIAPLLHHYFCTNILYHYIVAMDLLEDIIIFLSKRTIGVNVLNFGLGIKAIFLFMVKVKNICSPENLAISQY